jgi:hypothetical protein
VQTPRKPETATTGTPGTARITVAAEEVGAMEGAVAEAADAAAAAAGARTRLCLEKAEQREVHLIASIQSNSFRAVWKF